jgi:hypothetical protein
MSGCALRGTKRVSYADRCPMPGSGSSPAASARRDVGVLANVRFAPQAVSQIG